LLRAVSAIFVGIHLFAGSASARAPAGYEALFRCWKALESEDLSFRDPRTSFGKLEDGVYFSRVPLRGRQFGSRITLFHDGGLNAFEVRARRPPAHLVARLGGRPVLFVTFRWDPAAADTIQLGYLSAADRARAALPGRRHGLRTVGAGRSALAALEERLAAALPEARQALEIERARLIHDGSRRPGLPRARRPAHLATLRERLGRLAEASACSEIRGTLAEKAKPLAADLRALENLARDLDRTAAEARAAPAIRVDRVPLFPGARVATEDETRCLGFDGWRDEYDILLAFASARAGEVAGFYGARFGLKPHPTSHGYRLVLSPPSDANPLGDHIEVADEDPRVPCADGQFTVRVAVFRKKRA
jgi:hypothetical protein